ncbi:serine hydrolase domain-containing protein [Promicromonospora sp. NPDC023987]|uniref:serine hydrolase domain-containing protein n=1 Tax=Promicromonospora sp. NPDC023987 TaxID=3155360 RepID=UPI0033D64585
MTSLDSVSTWLDDHFADLVARHQVPGAGVAVLVDGEVVDAAAGVLSTTTGVGATTDSVFQIGSVTKLWTTSLLMRAVDDGTLDLDLPLRTYLPEFRVADDAASAAITTRQLLCHTAGFEGDVFTDTGRGDDAIGKYLAELHGLPQLFAPGAMFSYNNAGFALLGRLVEVVHKVPYDRALTELLAEPLGLTHVAPSPYEAILHRAAVGHVQGPDGNWTAAPVWALARSNAAAGSMLAMRPRDLVTFAGMHLAGGLAPGGTRVLSEQSVAAMQAEQVTVPDIGSMGDAWGLGWTISRAAGGTVVSHDGGTIGQAAFLRVVPGANVAVALLTNGGDVFGLYRDVVQHLTSELAGVTLADRPVPPAEPGAVDHARCAGTYSDTIYDLVISQDDAGRAWLDRTPKDVLAEIGEQPFRTELVRYADDALIAVDAPNGVHTVYAFLGDDGTGRAAFIHYGRAVARAVG